MVQKKRPRTKPLVGFAVDHFKGLNPSVIIDAMKIIGIEFVEINTSVFQDIQKSVHSISSIKTAFHLPYQSDIQLDKSPPGPQTLMSQILEYQKQLNIQQFISHPPEWPKDEAEFKIASNILFQNLLKLKLPVYFENVLSVGPDKFHQFLEHAQDSLGDQFGGQCWDAAHYLVAGYDPIKRYKLNAHQIGCIHLSDCFPDTDAHLPFSDKGSLPVDDIVQMLKNEKYTGTITLEMIPNSKSDIKSYITSYTMLLREMNYFKYISTQIRLFFLKPFLNKIVEEKSPAFNILNDSGAKISH